MWWDVEQRGWIGRGVLAGLAGAGAWMLGKRMRRRADADGHWRAAVLEGVATSTFSTIFVTLGARRIGRDAGLDWMDAAPAYFGNNIVSSKPNVKNIAGGVFVHQTAEFLWAVTYFGVMWPVSRRIPAPVTLVAGVPWAFLTSAIEYYIALPVIGRWVRMQTPYWVALTLHLVSSTGYGLFPLIYEAVLGHRVPGSRFARGWAVVLQAALLGMAGLSVLGRRDREFRWPSRDVRADGPDGTFLRHMTAHHEQGLELARMAAAQAESPELAKLGELMAAEHEARLRLMRSWWRSWFKWDMPGISEKERREMRGMIQHPVVEDLKRRSGKDFDLRYVPVMAEHHEGAVVMSNRVLEHGHDPRNLTLALSIRHDQLGQIAEMRRIAMGEAEVQPDRMLLAA